MRGFNENICKDIFFWFIKMKSVYNKIVRAAVPNSIAINEISDIQIANPQNDDVLNYQNGLWRNSKLDYNDLLNKPTIPGNLDNLSDVTINNVQTNQVLKYNGSQFINSIINYSELTGAPVIPTILDNLSDVTINNVQTNHTLIYSGSQWINTRQFLYLTNIISNGSNTFQVVPDTFYSLGSSAVLQMTSPILLSGGRRVFVFLNNGGQVVFPNGVFLDQATNFSLSCPITEAGILEFISSGSDKWVLKSFSGNIVRSNTQKALCNNNFNDLRDLNISNPNDDQYIGFDSNTFKFINRTLNNDYNEVINVTNGGLVAQYNKIYICNNAAIDMPTPVNGRSIKIINLSGPTVVINFTNRILWHYANFFNISIQTADACYIEFIALNNAWQVKSFTGRWINSATGLGLAVTQINDIRGVTLSSPTIYDNLQFNGSTWINKNSPQFITYNSANNIADNRFFTVGSGQNTLITNAEFICPRNMVFTRLLANVSVANTNGDRIFTIFLNGVATANILTLAGGNVNGFIDFNLPCVIFDRIAIRANQTGSPPNAVGRLTLEYLT